MAACQDHQRRPGLLQLPPELLGLIFSLLPTRDRVLALPLVCRQVEGFTKEPGPVWRSVEFETPLSFAPTDQAVEALVAYWARRGGQTTRLRIHNGFPTVSIAPSAWAVPGSLLACFPGLLSLYMPTCVLRHTELCQLARGCTGLQHLTACLCQATLSESGGLVSSFPALTALALRRTQAGIQGRLWGNEWCQPLLRALHRLPLLETLSLGLGDRLAKTRPLALPWPASLCLALPRLRCLTLPGGSVIHQTALQTLRRLTGLHCLETDWPAAWPVMSGLSSLEGLSLRLPRVIPVDAVAVHPAPLFSGSLTFLSVDMGVTDTPPARSPGLPLLELPRLRKLTCCPTMAECLQWHALSALECLELRRQLPWAWAQQAPALPGLTALKLSWLGQVAGDAQAAALPFLSHLRELELFYTELEALPADLAGGLLQSLALDSNFHLPFSEATVGLITGLPRLQHLKVCVCCAIGSYEELACLSEESLAGLSRLARRLPLLEPCRCLQHLLQ